VLCDGIGIGGSDGEYCGDNDAQRCFCDEHDNSGTGSPHLAARFNF
jgi:hypothetical protein